MKKPVMKKEINLDKLKEICQEYIDSIDSGSYHEDSDISHYIFEEDVWDFINDKLD